MIKFKCITLKHKDNKNHYYSRFNKNLSYTKFKEKNWLDQLSISFDYDTSYRSKKSFFKRYIKDDIVEYVKYLRNNVKRNSKILSIGSGRGVAELKLLDLGYNVTLSDINYPKGLKKLKQNFKDLKFIKFNILKNKINIKYDYIICFNLIYAFDQKKLNIFFKNCRKIINKNGAIIISPGSALLNQYKILFDRVYLPIETYFLYFLSFFKKKKFEIFKFHHGYTYSSIDIIKIAKKNNLVLVKNIIKKDFISEFYRSIIFKKLIFKNKKFRKILSLFGRGVPYVNFFYFKIEK